MPSAMVNHGLVDLSMKSIEVLLSPKRPRMTTSAASRQKLALADIKNFYYKQQYKQCLSACEGLLCDESRNGHPVRKAMILFFIGLVKDTQARNLSLRSPLLFSTLDEAKKSLLEGTATLPGLSTPSEEPQVQSIMEEVESPRTNRPSSGRSSLGSQESSPTLTSSGTTISDGSQYEDGASMLCNGGKTIDGFSPPSLTFGSEDFDDIETPNRVQLYNHVVATLHLLISRQLTSVESYGQFAKTALDREKRFGKLLSSKGMSEEEKLERIVRGRANGWNRPRFNPKHYKELCDRALGEL